MSQIGRISGAVLKDNLLRDGVDLAFETDLLYLKVSPAKQGTVGAPEYDDGDPNWGHGSSGSGIGINRDNPVYDLDINGNSNVTSKVIVDGSTARFDNIIFNTDGTVTTQTGPIIFEAATGATVEYGKVLTPDFEIKDNYIKATGTNRSIVLDPTGTVDVYGSAAITGDLSVTGNISSGANTRLYGKLIVGDSPYDTVTVLPDFTQSILPGDNGLYSLGSPTKSWGNVYVSEILETTTFNVSRLTTSDQVTVIGSSNTITSIQSNDALVLDSETGTVTIEDISINQNVITNLNSSALDISSTGEGYVHFTDSHGVRIPVGTTSERVGNEVGETRWNSDIGYLECFDGTVWQVATGGGTVVTRAVMEDFGNVYTLIFG